MAVEAGKLTLKYRRDPRVTEKAITVRAFMKPSERIALPKLRLGDRVGGSVQFRINDDHQ